MSDAKVILLTRSLGREVLSGGGADTSSASFELGLASALKGRCDLTVLQLGAQSVPPAGVAGLTFAALCFESLLGVPRLLHMLLGLREKGRGTWIISTGYYPATALAVLCARLAGCHTFTYVYDTHLTATCRMPWPRRVLANAYFALGFFLALRSSALLVLNDAFLARRKRKIAHLKTRVGAVALREQVAAPAGRGARPRLALAGTLNADNGVRLVLDTLRAAPDLAVEVDIYGSGDLQQEVVAQAGRDSRLHFHGRLADAALEKALQSADFLLNLRDPTSPSGEYAFPSKLVHYMAMGRPVLSNCFPGLDDAYQEHLLGIEAFSVPALLVALQNLPAPPAAEAIGRSAQSFVRENNGWDGIAVELLAFMARVAQ